jgi:tetratricopeptide (TPR) repeat protein
VVLAGAGRVQEAISHFEAALRIDPNSADAHVNLGIALSGIPGRMPEATRHFEAALRIKPDPEIRQMLDRLQKQR